MRIAFIVGKFPVLSETFILNQITGLIERGHQVDIYSLLGPASEAIMHLSVQKYCLLNRTYYFPKVPENYFWRWIKAMGLIFTNFYKDPVVCLRSLNFFKYGREAASLRMLYKSIPTLGKKPYDIIHCQFGNYGLVGLLLHQIGAIQGKLVTSFRGADISRYVKQNGEHVYNQLLETGDCFLPVCDLFRYRLIKLGCDEKKIVVHRSGIDCSKFPFSLRYPRPDGRIQVVTVGRLIEKKGIEYSIRAVAKLAKIYPNLEYKIIGDGCLREDLEQLIQELGISGIVKLLGWRHHQEIIEILNNSHIFIAPSVTAEDGNQEGIPNVLKEAMAMGLPVIATKHGGNAELIQDRVSGFLVPERDVDAIAKKLRYMVEHPEIWLEMGRAGRAYVEVHYNIHRLNDQLVEIYQKLLSDPAYATFSRENLKPSERKDRLGVIACLFPGSRNAVS